MPAVSVKKLLLTIPSVKARKAALHTNPVKVPYSVLKSLVVLYNSKSIVLSFFVPAHKWL